MLRKTVFLTLLFSLSCAYDVEEEIEELKHMFGDKVYRKSNLCYPGDHECTKNSSSHALRSKRFLLGTTCDPKLGCFSNDGIWKQRPIRLLPNSRATVNTQFILYTRRDRKNGRFIKADDLSSLNAVDVTKPLKMIIHGFIDSEGSTWQEPLRNELLDAEDVNIVIVNWGGFRGSKTLYTQATANTRVVAAEVSYLLRALKAHRNLDYSNVHIIGHSLGAHTGGYVGTNLTENGKPQLGRISGMDPAGPYFEGYHTDIRLDSSDAIFVDVLHTDGESLTELIKFEGGLGTAELSGHADFYPNGGKDQTGCNKAGLVDNVLNEGDIFHGLRMYFTCDHSRVIDYYRESIRTCTYRSYECSDYSSFLNAKCAISCSSNECNNMGYRAHKPSTGNKKYYSSTSGTGNFCATTYKIKIEMDPKSDQVDGKMSVVVHGSARKSETFQLNQDSISLSGNAYEYIIGVSNSMGSVSRLEFKWERDLSWWRIVSKACQWTGLCSREIRIKQITMSSATNTKLYFCRSEQPFESGKSEYLIYSSQPC